MVKSRIIASVTATLLMMAGGSALAGCEGGASETIPRGNYQMALATGFSIDIIDDTTFAAHASATESVFGTYAKQGDGGWHFTGPKARYATDFTGTVKGDTLTASGSFGVFATDMDEVTFTKASDTPIASGPPPSASATEGTEGTEEVDYASLGEGNRPNLGTIDWGQDREDKYVPPDSIWWEVIKVDPDTNRALMMMRDCIRTGQDGIDLGDTYSWQDNPVRAWLNSVFYDALPAEVKERVVETELVTAGEPTTDRVFLLSYEEATGTYFWGWDDATSFNVDGDAPIWLRPPETADKVTPGVFAGISAEGAPITLPHDSDADWYIRPVMWISLS
jgi:hypothetical protein